MGTSVAAAESSDVFIDRQTLCITQPKPNHILHVGDDGFREEVHKWYNKDESNAAERLIALKRRLQQVSTDDFWTMATEGLAAIAGAQYAFISKRILVDEEDAAVEMPPIGQVGSCLMSQAFYYNDGHGIEGQASNIKYFAYSCPCEHMKHDKVFVIPEELSIVIPNNPNQALLPFLAEGYLAVPIQWQGKVFAHFGVMWSQEGLNNRKLSLSFIEMMFHALEDTLCDGFLQRGLFAQSVKQRAVAKPFVPHQAVTAAQSLKPYARSLSHELRTPMQGVVGMLDIMYATVRETLEELNDKRVRQIFETLKENIEVVQDSSRRAVEAADNVVHAYDMNMGLPVGASSPELDGISSHSLELHERERRPEIVVTGDNIPLNLTKNNKRRRAEKEDQSTLQSAKKLKGAHVTPPPAPERQSSGDSFRSLRFEDLEAAEGTENFPVFTSPEHGIVPGLRHTNIRDLVSFLVFDLLKVGGRPESAIARDIEDGNGEDIEVISRCPDGIEIIKHVQWFVDPTVPETILIDEKDFNKMLSCVFLNAVKFTEEGKISLRVSMSPKQCYLVIRVVDTGPGIPETFLPNLFKAFSKEDAAINRRSEGLGLGLLVAKGLARKLGGDLACIRSNTSGPNRGSEFEMRLPINPLDDSTRAVSPFGSPAASRAASRQSSRSISKHPVEPSPALTHTSAPHIPKSPLPPQLRELPPQLLQHITFSGSSRTKNQSSPIPVPAPQDSAQPSPTNLPSTRQDYDQALAQKHPLTFLVVEDNKINRRLLVNMLKKLGYSDSYEAYDGADALRCMEKLQTEFNDTNATAASNLTEPSAAPKKPVDVILMDLWMPFMDGYEATEKILALDYGTSHGVISPPITPDDVGAQLSLRQKKPTVLAVTADVTDGALERAHLVGMKGFLSKPYKLRDLERLILEHVRRNVQPGPTIAAPTHALQPAALVREKLRV